MFFLNFGGKNNSVGFCKIFTNFVKFDKFYKFYQFYKF